MNGFSIYMGSLTLVWVARTASSKTPKHSSRSSSKFRLDFSSTCHPYTTQSSIKSTWTQLCTTTPGEDSSLNLKKIGRTLWRRYVFTCVEYYTTFNTNIQATVILSTNIGFLAIQSLDNLNTYSRTLAQIASYTSALLSLFDLIIVHILMRRHRQHVFDTAARGVCTLHQPYLVYSLQP